MEIKCDNCDAVNQNTSKYCSTCGYKLPINVNIIEEKVDNPAANKVSENKKTNKLKTTLGFFIGFAVMAVIMQNLFKAPSLDKSLMQFASELNRTCPIMIDRDTRLDNSIALPKDIFQYNYTLVNLEKENVNVEELKQYLIPIVTTFVKTNPDMKFARDNKVTVNYYYKDKNGIYLFTVSVTSEDYK